MEYKIEHKPPSFLETAFVAMLLGAVLVGAGQSREMVGAGLRLDGQVLFA